MDSQRVRKQYFYRGREFFCTLELVMSMIGGKWKPIALYHLKDGRMRSGELQRCLKGIANKMFTQTVRELEDNGLIERIVYPTVPPKVEYQLTDLGKSVIPVIDFMDNWGQKIAEREVITVL